MAFPTEAPSGRVHTKKEWSAAGESSLPNWLNKVGGTDVTLTFNDDQGALKLECASVDGGLQSGPIDPSTVSELRFGAAIKTNTDSPNTIGFGMVGQSGSIDELNVTNKHRVYQYNGNTISIELGIDGDIRDTGLPSLRDSEWHILEVRYLPDDQTAQVTLPHENGAESMGEWGFSPPTTDFYPSWGLNTSNGGVTDSFWLSKVWYEVIHD